ncbi:MAG: two-component system sensor histidine kinase CreC [Candidatus Thiodiazotropha sp. (ex Epidulcina cf. delphinae)]|nr:two-component system sensor histidine kinase CreC [Candidatus Thiodiazotropha sp. (ex Epidulcina cf. delphinae)]
MSIKARIFLIFVALVTAGFYVLVEFVQDELRPSYLESLEEPLVDTANLLAEVLAQEWNGESAEFASLHDVFDRAYKRRFRAKIYNLVKNEMDLRVYVTDARGIVRFDSDNRRHEGKDYSRWNDVYRTLRGQYGARMTHDDPLYPGKAVLYVAAPVYHENELIGVVSIGKPARNVDHFLEAAKSKIALMGLIAALLVLALGFILYRWITRPMKRLVDYVEAVKSGRRVTLPQLGRNEIGTMGAAMEEMRVALEGKDYAERYVQTLTHELKSPLAAIRGAAEILQEDIPDEERQKFLGNIREQVGRQQDIIDRMLELAALEKCRELEHREPIDVTALVDDVTAAMAPLCKKKSISLDMDLEPAKDLEGDPFLLRQALTNLLQNALKFSSVGGVITITARRHDGLFCFQITDQGPGIPLYAEDKVFERFYSLPAPNERKGTGLGLSFVHEIAALHGGNASLENGKESGAVASLCIP